ncbi:MAG: hypothetical protein K2X86_01100 [Cytophagaceae bacterium]|nr:hypothetical protein [Cytophagaceae bacterium]
MKLNLTDSILLALMVALLMIGGHQVFIIGRTEGISQGFLQSYWIFMLVIILMGIYQMRKNKAAKNETSDKPQTKVKSKLSAKKNKR